MNKEFRESEVDLGDTLVSYVPSRFLSPDNRKCTSSGCIQVGVNTKSQVYMKIKQLKMFHKYKVVFIIQCNSLDLILLQKKNPLIKSSRKSLHQFMVCEDQVLIRIRNLLYILWLEDRPNSFHNESQNLSLLEICCFSSFFFKIL